MSIQRIIAVALIFGLSFMAWMVLGSTVSTRSSNTVSKLRLAVTELWGEPVRQAAPECMITGRNPMWSRLPSTSNTARRA